MDRLTRREIEDKVNRILTVVLDASTSDDVRDLGDLALAALSLESVRSEALAEIVEELQRAIRKFPTWPTDPLHALAVLGEEFGELTKAMLQLVYEPDKTSLGEVHKEAIQTAAMALRLYASLDRYEYRRGIQHGQSALSPARVAEGGRSRCPDGMLCPRDYDRQRSTQQALNTSAPKAPESPAKEQPGEQNDAVPKDWVLVERGALKVAITMLEYAEDNPDDHAQASALSTYFDQLLSGVIKPPPPERP